MEIKRPLLNMAHDVTEQVPDNVGEDELGRIVYEYACARIRDNNDLSALIQSLLSPDDANPLLPIIASAILDDDAETVGRLIIDAVTAAAWTLAEQDSRIQLTTNLNTMGSSHQKKH